MTSAETISQVARRGTPAESSTSMHPPRGWSAMITPSGSSKTFLLHPLIGLGHRQEDLDSSNHLTVSGVRVVRRRR